MLWVKLGLIEDWWRLRCIESSMDEEGQKKVTCVTYSSITKKVNQNKKSSSASASRVSSLLFSETPRGYPAAWKRFRGKPEWQYRCQSISSTERGLRCALHSVHSGDNADDWGGGGGFGGGLMAHGWQDPILSRTFFFSVVCFCSNRGQFGDWNLGDFPLFLCCKEEFRQTKSNPFNRSYIKYKIQHACCLVIVL